MPEIYSGDEIAMKGGADPDNRRDFPGGFGPSQPDAFVDTCRTPEQQQAFTGLQKLLTLRRLHPALQTGDEQVLHADGDVLIFARTLVSTGGSQHILVAVNKASTSRTVAMITGDTEIAGLQQAISLLGNPATLSITAHAITLQLAPESAAILDLR
jgi:glycosidase